MKKIRGTLPTNGQVHFEIEVEDDFDESDTDAVFDAICSDTDCVDLDEHDWDWSDHLVRGNVWYGEYSHEIEIHEVVEDPVEELA